MARHCRRLGGGRLWLLGRRCLGSVHCPPILVTLVQLVTEPQRSLFVAAPTPAGSRGVRLTLCDGPTLSETRGRPFVAPRAAVSRQVCTLPANFGDLVQLVTEPQRSLFVAAPTPAGSRGVRLTLCDGPTLSETRGRPFVAPRAAVLQYARQFLQLWQK